MPFNYSATFNNALLRAYSSNPAVYGRGGFGNNRAGVNSPGFSNINPQGEGSAASGTLGSFGVGLDNTDPRVQDTNLRYYKKHLKNNSNMEQMQTIGVGVQTGVAGALGLLTVGTALRDLFSPPTTMAWLDAPSSQGTSIRSSHYHHGY